MNKLDPRAGAGSSLRRSKSERSSKPISSEAYCNIADNMAGASSGTVGRGGGSNVATCRGGSTCRYQGTGSESAGLDVSAALFSNWSRAPVSLLDEVRSRLVVVYARDAAEGSWRPRCGRPLSAVRREVDADIGRSAVKSFKTVKIGRAHV